MADTNEETTVLVTGATGTVGREVVAHLRAAGIGVRALTRDPARASLPRDVPVVAGELTDPDAMHAALDGVDGVFLLSPVAMEELTGTLLTLDLVRRTGVRALVYLSVIHADRFTDPPHFAAKGAAERMIAEYGLPATTLRPGYFMQNDLAERDRMSAEGVYGPPIGRRGSLAVDVRDLAEVAAVAIRRRLEVGGAAETLDVVAPEPLTGDSVAGVWSELLGREVVYGGDDVEGLEQGMRAVVPPWTARDMRLMFARFVRDGMSAAPGTDERLRELLGRPMRSYRDFAADAVAGRAA